MLDILDSGEKPLCGQSGYHQEVTQPGYIASYTASE